MTHTPHAGPPRPHAEYRRTNRKAHAFLDALALHGKVPAAARAVGMTRQSAYRLRHCVPVMAEGWAQAQAIGHARRQSRCPRALPEVPAALSQGDTSRGKVTLRER